tara:strand:+ start:668 stop:1429 length:762 start_codon:yes stop_codon:yes gene_type:complete
MNILKKIIAEKELEIKKLNYSGFDQAIFNPKDFMKSLLSNRISIIAEIKFKSPSMGQLLDPKDVVKIAKNYESAGASAISILTDKKFFDGDINFLKQVASEVSIPVLRKDFILSKAQIIESGINSADSLLLISEILESSQLNYLYNFARKLNLIPLVELHSRESLAKVFDLNPKIVGVNCRNLETMETNLKHFEELITELPKNSIKVAESGISSSEDIKYINNLGYDAVLVGTSLMRNNNPGKALEELIGGVL